MLEVVGDQRPERHNELLRNEQFLQELGRDDLSVFTVNACPRALPPPQVPQRHADSAQPPQLSRAGLPAFLYGPCHAAIGMNKLAYAVPELICMCQHIFTLGLSCLEGVMSSGRF